MLQEEQYFEREYAINEHLGYLIEHIIQYTVYIVTNEQCYCKIYLMIYLIADLVIPFNVILL